MTLRCAKLNVEELAARKDDHTVPKEVVERLVKTAGVKRTMTYLV